MKKTKKNKSLLTVLILSITGLVSAQNGVGSENVNVNSCAALNIQSSTRGFLPPRMTTAQRNAIVNPVAGLMIFNTTKNCIEWYLGTFWYNGCGDQEVSFTTNGSAVVSGYNCNANSSGIMKAGVSVSGVSQTITAIVETAGTYSISAAINGVNFTGSGAFKEKGLQNIVLTAVGTPTASGTHEFTLNTKPHCSFNRKVN